MASKTMTRSVRMINRKKLKLSILSFKVHIIILNIIIKNVLLLTDSEKLLDLNVVLEAKRQGNQWKWGQILFVVSVCHSLFRMVRLRSWKEIKKRFFKRKRIYKKKNKKLYYILLLILLQKDERYVGSDQKWRTLKSD